MLHLQQAQSHELSARHLHEVLEPAAVGWFLLPHKNPAAWILMHRPRQAAEWPVAAHNSIVIRTVGAHIVHRESTNQPG